MCREKTDRTKNRVLNEFGMVDDSDRDVTQGRWCRASEVKKTKSRPNENKSRLGETVYREYCQSLTKRLLSNRDSHSRMKSSLGGHEADVAGC